MATRISNAAAIVATDVLVALLDAGAGAGYIEIRTGTQPADLSVAASGTLLGTLTLSDPAFGAAADDTQKATATANSITGDTAADADGTAGWFRAYDSNALAVIDGSVGLAAADMILDDVTIVTNNIINVSSWTVTLSEL